MLPSLQRSRLVRKCQPISPDFSARTDQLQIFHWQRSEPSEDVEMLHAADNQPPTSASTTLKGFARFNRQISVMEYTQDEYRQLFSAHDEAAVEGQAYNKGWTREETDYLLDLCRQYDLRFIVINDRYRFPGGPSRSIEDLQERYYHVTSTLAAHRNPLPDPNQKAEIAHMKTYDRAKEIERKEYVNRLSNRTAEEVHEEELLLAQVRHIQATHRIVDRQREDLLRCLKGESRIYPSLTQLLAESANSSSNYDSDSKMKRKYKKKEPSLLSLSSPRIDIPAPPAVAAIRKQVARKPSTPVDESYMSQLKKEKKTTGVYLRSQACPTVKTQLLQSKIQAQLQEHNIAPLPTLFTKLNCQHHEELYTSVIGLLDLKRQHDRLEAELRQLQSPKDGRRTTTSQEDLKKRTIGSPSQQHKKVRRE